MSREQEFLDALGTISELMQDFECINSGGCGVFAGMIAGHLKRVGINHDVATYVSSDGWGGGGATAVQARKNNKGNVTAQDWWEAGLSDQHLAARFKLGGQVYLYDCHGVDNDDLFYRWDLSRTGLGTGLTAEETQRMSANGVGWNSSFDRRQVSEMQVCIDAELYEFKDKEFACTTVKSKPARAPSVSKKAHAIRRAKKSSA